MTDGIEVNTSGTEPAMADTDGYGVPDGEEDGDGVGLILMQRKFIVTLILEIQTLNVLGCYPF